MGIRWGRMGGCVGLGRGNKLKMERYGLGASQVAVA
jgi:hypothetical protein